MIQQTDAVSASAATTADASSTDSFAKVDRVSGIDMETFVRCYRLPRRPVVLTDALKNWKACERFTPEFFLENYGDMQIRVGEDQYRLGDAIRLLMNADEEHPGPYPCAIHPGKNTECVELISDIMPRIPQSLPNRHTHPLVSEKLFNSIGHLDIFFGGQGSNFPFPHYDFLRMHGWVAQVYGDKEMTLYEPGQEELLYVDPERPWRSKMENSGKPDFERYPLFRQARSHKVVVHAGEALFIPCGTWHTAHCLNMGISVLFDQLEPSNWKEFTGEVMALRKRAGQRGKAALVGAYLRMLGPVMSMVERFGANRRADWGVPASRRPGMTS